MSEKYFMCPYYKRLVNEFECYDMCMIANRNFVDESVVKEEDRDPLNAMCNKCGKYKG